MAAIVCVVLMLAMVGVSEGAWCVCRPDVGDSSLQKALDYACGAGADCTTIHQGGACYSPNTVRAHCSFAANSYYQRKGQSQQACDFSGAATLTPQDPSSNGCTFPASPSAAGTGGANTNTNTSTGTNSPGSTTPTTVPGTATPGTFTPNTGTGTGGVLGGSLGPSMSSTDTSDGVPGALMMVMMPSLLVLILPSILILFDN